MEITSPIIPSYTFVEKYFKILPEQRIRRYQFFVRFLMPWVILVNLIPIFMGICGIFIWVSVTEIIYSSLFLGIGYAITRKRCNDFGGNGMIAIPIFVVYTIKSLFVSGFLANLEFGLNTSNQVTKILFLVTAYIDEPASILMFVTFLVLLFRPGKKEENQYGKAEYAKVSFLG